MSRVLLVAVNSQYIHSNPALYALTRSAEQANCADLLDRMVVSINMPAQEILTKLYEKRPEVLAFSVYIWNAEFLAPILRDIHLLLPETKILLGGPEASARAAHYLSTLPVDGVCVGEGEDSFAEMLLWLKQQPAWTAPPQIPGWMWAGREADYTPAPPPDLAKLPFLYTEAEGQALKAEKKIVYYESSRGCPCACSFCASATVRLRERPLDLVFDDLPRLAEIGGQIKFVDRSFNADPARAVAITKRVLELFRPGLSWHFEILPSRISEELLDLWLSAPRGYLKLEMGVQTLNPKALALVGRREAWEPMEPQVKRLIENGRTHLHLDLIAGLPGDTPEGFAASFHRLHQLSPDYLQFGFLKLLPGSLLARRAKEFGLVASDHTPYQVLATPDMSADYLFRLHRTERMFNMLYNRGDSRELLLEKAERMPGGAIALYEKAAELHPTGGLSPRQREELVQAL